MKNSKTRDKTNVTEVVLSFPPSPKKRLSCNSCLLIVQSVLQQLTVQFLASTGLVLAFCFGFVFFSTRSTPLPRPTPQHNVFCEYYQQSIIQFHAKFACLEKILIFVLWTVQKSCLAVLGQLDVHGLTALEPRSVACCF